METIAKLLCELDDKTGITHRICVYGDLTGFFTNEKDNYILGSSFWNLKGAEIWLREQLGQAIIYVYCNLEEESNGQND